MAWLSWLRQRGQFLWGGGWGEVVEGEVAAAAGEAVDYNGRGGGEVAGRGVGGFGIGIGVGVEEAGVHLVFEGRVVKV